MVDVEEQIEIVIHVLVYEMIEVVGVGGLLETVTS